mmetsp:Transcript_33020/g.95280  ORF Transcript_33020/g.95280 Transcript_33020/m.95280 type:complete len:250 (-) Transcript_33020:166-915(-)
MLFEHWPVDLPRAILPQPQPFQQPRPPPATIPRATQPRRAQVQTRQQLTRWPLGAVPAPQLIAHRRLVKLVCLKLPSPLCVSCCPRLQLPRDVLFAQVELVAGEAEEERLEGLVPDGLLPRRIVDALAQLRTVRFPREALFVTVEEVEGELGLLGPPERQLLHTRLKRPLAQYGLFVKQRLPPWRCAAAHDAPRPPGPHCRGPVRRLLGQPAINLDQILDFVAELGVSRVEGGVKGAAEGDVGRPVADG